MQYTSAEANKLLKSLNTEKDRLVGELNQKKSFVAAIEENVEDVRPEFDLSKALQDIDEVERKICLVKHAISSFNTIQTLNYEAPNGVATTITIDQALVVIPMLKNTVDTLQGMIKAMPKTRENNVLGKSTHIEYRYANYDIDEAKKHYTAYQNALNSIQLALDKVNQTEVFEIAL